MIGVRLSRSKIIGVAVASVFVALFGVASADAESLSPWWMVTSGARPTSLQRGAEGKIVVTVENLGDGAANGEQTPVQIRDTLPHGLKALAIKGSAITQRLGRNPKPGEGQVEFEGEAGPVECATVPTTESPLTCAFESGSLLPYESIEIIISVLVEPGASSGEENTISVFGGGVPADTTSRPIEVGGESRFGVQESQFVPEDAGGGVDTQAGSHPFQLTSVVAFNQTGETPPKNVLPVGLPKDVSVLAPAGLIGNPTPFAECTDVQFSTRVFGEENLCPAASAIGVATITYDVPGEFEKATIVAPVFNMVPNPGEPARFGFDAFVVPVTLNTSVRTGGDYGVTVSTHNIIQVAGLLSTKVTLWGVPGDPRHNGQRGWGCLTTLPGQHFCPTEGEGGDEVATATPPPFLSLPTSCTGPLQASVQADSWEQPKEVLTSGMSEPLASLVGCNHLPFAPEVSVTPDVADTSTPTGLTVKLHVPQTAALNPAGLAESTVRNTTVTLPEGMQLSPSAADGLMSCSLEQIGLESDSEASCPEASKIATVEIKSPLLPNPLVGEVYLAAQEANPFGSLVAMYLVARDPVSGVLVKLAGKVIPDPVTGQLVATFENTPQLPFEDLTLHFFGGARAPLATPARCGSYTTQTSLAPWSGNPVATPSSSFQITSGPNGSPCPGSSLPFAPLFTGGTTNIQAGAFSVLDSVMSREDGNQNLQAIQLHFPPGFTGLLSSTKLCGEPQADEGKCGPESLIGHSTVSVGLGGDPFTVTGGEVFITGPYNGQSACTVGSPGCASFGLSIKTPAKAGPYDVAKGTPCDCVVVRAKVEVDPHTAALTVTTDDAGPYKIPTILDGIPLQIKHVAVTVDKPGFTINPTDCNPMAITGTLSSTEGASAPLSIPFQVTNCANLQFAPKFAVSTSGKTSKANGASLTAKVSYPSAPQGSQADIARVKVDLPKVLPSRLTTLQKACTNAQFEANPAACPPGSKVGFATVTTSLLPVPLTGPAIFVSHGGEAFPSLTMVLQGYGVSIDLVGSTFISKAGITSTTFKSVPDTPFNTFTLTLPEGPYSALAAVGDLCTSKLAMPTEFVAQNGATIHESTKIGVTGCAKAKSLSRAQRLTKALKACRKKRKGKRTACEKQARKQYGPAKGAKKSKQH
jgi:hypothetical protein